jgi:hypothetical protein
MTQTLPPPDPDAPNAGRARARSAHNLFVHCANLTPGDRVLLVGEDDPAPWFDPAVCELLAAQARALGLQPEIVLAPVDGDGLPDALLARMRAVSATIFCSRIGGRARFHVPDMPGAVVNCHAARPAHLLSPFCALDYRVQRQIHDALVARIAAARRYRITAPCGTDLSGSVPQAGDGALVPFALRVFPVMIFPPVLCPDLSGTLVIDHFVTSSGTRRFEDSVLRLDGPLRAAVSQGRIVGIEGPAEVVARLEAQMQRAAALTGGDPMRINSWHTGINPHTFTETVARDDPDQWGAVAFGAPRYTHFHAAGHDPGDIAFSLFDATIAFDGVPFWQEGRFVFPYLPEIAATLPAAVLSELAPAGPVPLGRVAS